MVEESRVDKLELRVNNLETRLAIAETNIKEIYKTLDSINKNTTWILRIIIGAIIGALLALIFKGGL